MCSTPTTCFMKMEVHDQHKHSESMYGLKKSKRVYDFKSIDRTRIRSCPTAHEAVHSFSLEMVFTMDNMHQSGPQSMIFSF
jgi:hypothetical protein